MMRKTLIPLIAAAVLASASSDANAGWKDWMPWNWHHHPAALAIRKPVVLKPIIRPEHVVPAVPREPAQPVVTPGSNAAGVAQASPMHPTLQGSAGMQQVPVRQVPSPQALAAGAPTTPGAKRPAGIRYAPNGAAVEPLPVAPGRVHELHSSVENLRMPHPQAGPYEAPAATMPRPTGMPFAGVGVVQPQALAGGPGPSLQSYTSTQSQILLMEKEISSAELEVKLQQDRNKLRDLKSQAQKLSPIGAAKQSYLDVSDADPHVLQIQEGPASPISAQLQLPQGEVLTIHKGDLLPDGWTVAQIRPSMVIVSKAGKPSRIYPVLTIPASTQSLVASDLTQDMDMPPLPEAPTGAGKSAKAQQGPSTRLTKIPKFPGIPAGAPKAH